MDIDLTTALNAAIAALALIGGYTQLFPPSSPTSKWTVLGVYALLVIACFYLNSAQSRETKEEQGRTQVALGQRIVGESIRDRQLGQLQSQIGRLQASIPGRQAYCAEPRRIKAPQEWAGYPEPSHFKTALGLSFGQRAIESSYQMPSAIELEVRADNKVQKVGLLIELDKPIDERLVVEWGFRGYYAFGGTDVQFCLRSDRKSYSVAYIEPYLTPDRPLLLRFFSAQAFGVKNVKIVSYSDALPKS